MEKENDREKEGEHERERKRKRERKGKRERMTRIRPKEWLKVCACFRVTGQDIHPSTNVHREPPSRTKQISASEKQVLPDDNHW